MKKLLLLSLLVAAPLTGQSAMFSDSNCSGPVLISCTWSTPRPNGRFVFIAVTGVQPGDIVTMCYGFSHDLFWTAAQLPLPFDMGNLFPSMAGCSMMTSAVGTTMMVATSPGVTFWYDVNHMSPEVTFQVMTSRPGVPGFDLSALVLRYRP